MGVAARLAGEVRYLKRLVGTLSKVRSVRPGSTQLVCDDWEAAADRHGPRTAVRAETGALTYEAYDALANRFAHWALAAGLQRGDTVAVFLPNRLEYVAAWIGLAKVGVVSALINNNLAGQALTHCIDIAQASHVLVDADTAAALEAARPRLARPVTVWSLDDPGGDHRDLRQALDQASPVRPERSVRAGITAGALALYIYTSGTTGLPKAAKVTHVKAQTYMRGFWGATAATDQDRVYIVLPLYHATGGLCAVGAALLSGGTAVVRKRFSAARFWDDVTAEGCTLFVYIGELCRYLVNQPERPHDRAHRLRLAFGNGLRPEVWERFKTRFAIPHILEFYGATEGNVSILNFDEKPGSIGRIAPYIRSRFNVKLVRLDDTGEPLRSAEGFCVAVPPGEVGEAVGEITSAPRYAYAGYADQQASERKVLRGAFRSGDAWFRTGDLMRQDRGGYFYFVDRLGDTFRWKGENVSTSEVCEVVCQAPGVKEANVYGVEVPGADGRAGMAALVAGPDFDLAAFAERVDRDLPAYARPVFLRLQPEIQTTGTFKYTKTELVAQGFDPARTTDPLFVRDAGGRYVPLTGELHARLLGGELRL
jgi:fatty-acyl-CoA synthase